MCIFILSKPRMANMPSVFMMKILAYTDLVTVVVSQGHIFTTLFDCNPVWNQLWLCKLWPWVVAIFTYFSSYTIAGFSIDRCLAIALPLKYSMFPHKKKCLSGFLIANFLIGVAFNSYSVMFFDFGYVPMEDKVRCNNIMHLDRAFFGWSFGPWMSFILSVFLPETIIVACNTITIISFLRHRQVSKNMTSTGAKESLKNEQVQN